MSKAARAVLNPTTPIKWYDRRLITCEMHRIPPATKGGLEAEKVVIRVMVPTKLATSSRDDDDDSDDESESDSEGTSDAETLDTRGSSSGEPIQWHHFDSIGPMGGLCAGRFEGFELSEFEGGGSSMVPLPTLWKTRKQLNLNKMHVVSHLGDKVLLSVGMGHSIKKVKFESEQDANGFVQLVSHLRSGQRKRMKQRKIAAINSLVISDEDATVNILVEITSCWALPAADMGGTSDPYVRASFEGREVHRTKPVFRTTEPIYTIKTGSLFILSATMRKLFDAREGLKFTVKDYDTVGSNENLGVAIVAPRTLYDANGERMVLPLIPEVGKSFAKGGNGFIAFRCRKATEQDVSFMKKLSGGLGNVVDTSPSALSSKGTGRKSAFESLVTPVTKKETDHTARGIESIVKKYRVSVHAIAVHVCIRFG